MVRWLDGMAWFGLGIVVRAPPKLKFPTDQES